MRQRARLAAWRWLDRRADWIYRPGHRWAYRHDDLLTEIHERIDRAVCRVLGHVPVPDMCGIPDHDYCALCRASTPGQGDRPEVSSQQ